MTGSYSRTRMLELGTKMYCHPTKSGADRLEQLRAGNHDTLPFLFNRYDLLMFRGALKIPPDRVKAGEGVPAFPKEQVFDFVCEFQRSMKGRVILSAMTLVRVRLSAKGENSEPFAQTGNLGRIPW